MNLDRNNPQYLLLLLRNLFDFSPHLSQSPAKARYRANSRMERMTIFSAITAAYGRPDNRPLITGDWPIYCSALDDDLKQEHNAPLEDGIFYCIDVSFTERSWATEDLSGRIVTMAM